MIEENQISSCVRDAVKKYLSDLDGEKPCALYDMVLRCVEKPLIELVLDHTRGNQTQAAELLGLNRNTLRKKMQSYRIP